MPVDDWECGCGDGSGGRAARRLLLPTAPLQLADHEHDSPSTIPLPHAFLCISSCLTCSAHLLACLFLSLPRIVRLTTRDTTHSA